MMKRSDWSWWDISLLKICGLIWLRDLAILCHRLRTVGWSISKIFFTLERKSCFRKMFLLWRFRAGLNFQWRTVMQQWYKIAQKLWSIFQILMEKSRNCQSENSFGKWCTHWFQIKLKVTSCRLIKKEDKSLTFKIKDQK